MQLLLQDTNHLRQLTDAVNAAIAEEYNLFGFPDDVPVLSPGVVRVACNVFAARKTENERDSLPPLANASDAGSGGLDNPIQRILRVDDIISRKTANGVPIPDDDPRDPPPVHSENATDFTPTVNGGD